MLNVVEFGRHVSRPTADLNVHEAQELMNDLFCDPTSFPLFCCIALFLYFEMYLEHDNKDIHIHIVYSRCYFASCRPL